MLIHSGAHAGDSSTVHGLLDVHLAAVEHVDVELGGRVLREALPDDRDRPVEEELDLGQVPVDALDLGLEVVGGQFGCVDQDVGAFAHRDQEVEFAGDPDFGAFLRRQRQTVKVDGVFRTGGGEVLERMTHLVEQRQHVARQGRRAVHFDRDGIHTSHCSPPTGACSRSPCASKKSTVLRCFATG